MTGVSRYQLRILLLPVILIAGQVKAIQLNKEDLNVSGYVDAGRFQLPKSSANGEVINRMGAKWNIDKNIDEHWSAFADIHWLFWRNQATDLALFHVAGLKFNSDLQGSLKYQNGDHLVKGGLYEFKYNPDSKNLGEYLLRSEAYPTILESSQGQDLLAKSSSRVMGIEYNWYRPIFRQTGLFYAEQFNVPVNDLSLAYLAAMGPKSAEVGLGIAYHRAVKLGKEMNTTVLDPNLRKYIKDNGLDQRAFKFSLRGRVDVGALIGNEIGFRIYGEAALLGTKNDTLFYKDMTQRMPVMMGIDFPTLGFFNLLSLEVEYFKNPYLERKYPIKDANGTNFSALPFLDDYNPGSLPHDSKDDWRWSLFAQKSLSKWVDIKFRAANDHLRLLNWDGDYEGGSPMTGKTSSSSGWLQDYYILARIEFHN